MHLVQRMISSMFESTQRFVALRRYVRSDCRAATHNVLFSPKAGAGNPYVSATLKM